MESTAAAAEPIAPESRVPKPLIAGYDGREAGLDALALADALATARGDHVIAAYVSEWLPPQAANDRHRQLDVRARLQVLRGAVDEILPDGGNGRPVAICDVPAHNAAVGLHDVATSEGARAIVLGSTHRGPVGRVAVGATGARLLIKAPCSLAVAPRGFRDHNKRLERVAVAVDGCADCEDALHEAMSLTSALAGSLVALAVVPLPGRIRATPRRAGELLARVGSMLERCGAGDVKRQVLEGSPARAIARATEDFDLLVVGCRAAGGPLGHPTLRVSRELMHGTGVPVIVVPGHIDRKLGTPNPSTEAR
jgi:nucleotide-binding universal stress UspA family protein